MTKKSIIVACGTAVLAIAGYLTTSAHKYAATASAYFRTTTTSAFITLFKGQTAGVNMHLTTVANTNHTAFFKTKGMTGDKTLFATKGTTTKLYYK